MSALQTDTESRTVHPATAPSVSHPLSLSSSLPRHGASFGIDSVLMAVAVVVTTVVKAVIVAGLPGSLEGSIEKTAC